MVDIQYDITIIGGREVSRPYQMERACQICESIMTQGHAFGMFRCKLQRINALETCRRHVPTLWCCRFRRFLIQIGL